MNDLTILLIFILGAFILFIYNCICYKTKKTIHTFKKNIYEISNDKYYSYQFNFFNLIVVFYLILTGFIISKKIFNFKFPNAIILIVGISFFWFINNLLESNAKKRKLIEEKG